MTYRDLRPDDVRQVRVLTDDGRWVDGWLEAQRQVDGVWSGWVRFTTGLAETRIDWFEEARIKAPRPNRRPT